MRKLVITALISGMSAFGVVVALPAHADSSCRVPGNSGPASAGQINDGTAPAGTTNGVQVCTNTGPLSGTVTAAGTEGPPPSGYLVADGKPSNPGALGGYIGVDSAGPGGTPEVVGCSGQQATTNTNGTTNYSGEYQPGAGTSTTGNNAIASTGGVSTPNPPGTPPTKCDAHS